MLVIQINLLFLGQGFSNPSFRVPKCKILFCTNKPKIHCQLYMSNLSAFLYTHFKFVFTSIHYASIRQFLHRHPLQVHACIHLWKMMLLLYVIYWWSSSLWLPDSKGRGPDSVANQHTHTHKFNRSEFFSFKLKKLNGILCYLLFKYQHFSQIFLLKFLKVEKTGRRN